MGYLVNINQITISIIYRPSHSKQNSFKILLVFDEWSNYLGSLSIITSHITITGYLNFHGDNKSEVIARSFIEYSLLNSIFQRWISH